MSSPVHPLQALAVYAEALVVRRRVVVFGVAGTGIEERLEELGALSVERVGPDDDLSAWRGTRFDLALVTDLGLFDDPEDLLVRLRLAVGDTGVALVAATNRDTAGPDATGAFDYYDLFDLVAGQFADVRMIARLPFHGVTLAEVSDDDSPAVSVDTQLVDEDHSPEAFVALASQRGVSLDPYAIIELPPPRPPATDHAQSRALQEELAQERARIQAVSEQVQALESRASATAELERELAARRRQIAELSSEVEEKRAAAEAGRIAAAQVGDLALRADRAERLVARVEPELTRLAEAHALELARIEEALFERAGIIQQLEAELARRERMVLDLVQTLEEHSGPRPSSVEPAPQAPRDERVEMALAEENARLRERLDALALDLARREGEAQAAAWSIAELERRLGPSSDRSGPPAGEAENSENKLMAALDELDALRKALVQEHEARARAESAAAGAAGKGAPGPDLPA
jgi:hypothetical protein